MQPLIGSSRTGNYNTSSWKHKAKKYWNKKALCIAITTILFIVVIVAVTTRSSSHLSNNNQVHQAHTFVQKPDNGATYPSTIQWRDPKKKLPPKPGTIPNQGAEDLAAPNQDEGTAFGNWADPEAWKNPPPGTDGASVNGITYGGDDVTTIDEEPEEGETSQYVDEHPPDYPTTVTIERSNEIIASDPNDASVYYKENGADDIIASMPFLVTETCAQSVTNCGFKQYSGYLLANNNAEIHYWFIEAEENALNKPVFFWTNGGPGCSALDGLLTEHGPWRVTDNLKIHYNPYSWNKEVNIVYLEQPFGVGFSAAETEDMEVSGDQNAADDMDAAIRNWLKKFPSYKHNKLYLSSESWGGHYVPITSYTILKNNDAGAKPHINFGGFFLGNPYTDFYENAYGFVGGVYGHGLMKSADWDSWRSNCWGNEEALDTDATCSAIYSRAYISAYNSNVYALDWPQCYDDEDWNLDLINRPAPEFWRFYNYNDAHIHHAARGFMEKVLSHHDYNELKMNMDKSTLQLLHERIVQRLELEEDEGLPGQQKPEDGESIQGIPQQPAQGTRKKPRAPNGVEHNRPNHNIGRRARGGGGSQAERDEAIARMQEALAAEQNVQEYGDGYLPCIEYDMADYLNLNAVQEALHVKSTEWEMCSKSVWNAWPETDYDAKIEAYYAEIIDNYVVSKELKLAVYSGDDDSVCGLQGTQYWLDRWQYNVNTNVDWSPWQDDDSQLGGFYSQYMTLDGESVALHFFSVRTAGHMVPTTEPARALNILKKYLYDLDKDKEDEEDGTVST